MKKQFYTTGEAADILGISRATISRKFDSGQLSGSKNPFTGQRLISQESLISFAKKYSVDFTNIKIKKNYLAIVSPSQKFTSLVRKTVSFVKNIEFRIFSTGFDALVSFADKLPDICIIDNAVDDFPTIHLIKVIHSLILVRKTSVHIVIYTNFEERDKFIDFEVEELIYKGAQEETMLKDILYPLISIDETTPKHNTFSRRRKCPRVSVNIPVRIDIISTQNREIITKDKGTISNISLSGAFIRGLNYHHELIPSDNHRLILYAIPQHLTDWQAEAKTIHIQGNHQTHAGIQFTAISEHNTEILSKIVTEQH